MVACKYNSMNISHQAECFSVWVSLGSHAHTNQYRRMSATYFARKLNAMRWNRNDWEQEDSASVKEMQWYGPQYRDIFFNSRIARYVCGNAFYSVHSPISSYRSNYLLDFFLHSFPLSLFLSLFTHFKFHLFRLFLLYTFSNLLLASNRKIIANEIENDSTTRMKLHFIIKFLWHIDGKLNWRHRNAQRLTPSARNINEREGETRSECNAFNAVRSI